MITTYEKMTNPDKKYVKCINVKGVSRKIKLGQIYELIRYAGNFIDIIINDVEEKGFYSHRFEEVYPNIQKLKDFK